ncbi:MAG: cyclic-phosphate processing receiver domain-containing protein, partial [Aggregatilineales bacterium]
MNILLLEDSLRRIKFFKAGLQSHQLTICQHAKSAKKALKKQQFDMIFLDHDLRGRPEHPDSDNCGTEVARYIVDYDIQCDWIILHTENAIGREAMEAELLERCQTIPYNKLKKIGLRAILERIISEV